MQPNLNISEFHNYVLRNDKSLCSSQWNDSISILAEKCIGTAKIFHFITFDSLQESQIWAQVFQGAFIGTEGHGSMYNARGFCPLLQTKGKWHSATWESLTEMPSIHDMLDFGLILLLLLCI